MTAPNRNVLWANALVDELVAAGVDAVVASPGSRSTPLTVAAASHEELTVFSQLDERSAAYFALGRARRTGRVTPLICTSGTAAANYHPAVMEASEARVPLLALTADRPPELRDSGANQTADQEKLYGDAVRFYKDLPEPAANDRALADPLSGLRYGGHTRVAPVIGRYDAYLSADLADEEEESWTDPDVVLRLGASPTSKRLRKYLAATGADQYQVDPAGRWREAEFAATDLVVAEPSRLCARLSRLVGGGSGDADWRAQWEEADRVAEAVHAREWDGIDAEVAVGDEGTTDDETAIEDVDAGFHEGDALRAVAEALPDPATLFVSNSMPVRDLDRFVGPTTASVTALGNRGVSGIDGIVSSALGARAGTTDDLTLVLGDLALYHDSNGLLAVERCDADATVVTVNNDGGGIFHKLPIESFEPPFTESFRTPHGLDFEPLAALHGLEYERIDARPDALADRGESPAERADAVAEEVAAAVSRSHEEPGSHLIDVETDAEASHRTRERLAAAVDDAVHGDAGGE